MSVRQDQANLILTINGAQAANTLQDMEKSARDLRRLLSKIPVDSKEFKEASAKAAELDKRIKETKESMRAMKNEGVSLTGTLTRIGGTIAVVAATVRGFFSSLSGASKLEQLNISFEVFLGSAEKAKQVVADLRKFADLTPFETEPVNQAGRALLAFGFSAEELIPTLTKVGDVAAGTGKDFNELALIYGKARAEGIIQNDTLNQLAEAGIPVYQELAKVLGVAENRIRKLAENGEISFRDLERVFTNLTSEGGRFAGLMERQSKSLDGLFSTLASAIQGKVTNAITGLFPLIKSVTQAFIDFLNVPLSETLEQERQAFNGLALGILNAKEGTDERTAGIRKLQEQYPAFLGNIDAEKATNEQLRPILEQINQSYVIRIALQKQQEKLQPLLEAQAEQEARLAEGRVAANRLLARGAELAGVNLQQFRTEAEQTQAVIKALERTAEFRRGLGFDQPLNDQARVLNEIKATASQIDATTINQRFATKQATEAEQQRQEVVAELRKTYADVFKILDAEAAKTTNGDSPAGKAKKEAEAAEGSLAALRKRIADLQKLIEATPADSKALAPLIRELTTAEKRLKDLEEYIKRLKNPQIDLAPTQDAIQAQLGSSQAQGDTTLDEAQRLAIVELNDFRIREEELTTDELNRFRQGLSDEDSRRRQKALEEEKQLRENIRNLNLSAAESISRAVIDIEANRISQETDTALRAIDAEYKARIDAAGGNSREQARLQKELETKKEAIEKDAARKRKSLAIKEAVIAGALAVVKALPNVFAAAAAGVAAAAQIAVISSQQFAGGGYTGPGHGSVPDRTGHRPVGIVHAHEWVSPPWMTKHPVWGQQIAALEAVRQRGFADGGFSTTPTVAVTPIGASDASATAGMDAFMLLAGEFRKFRNDVSAWQSRLRVVYTDIRDAGEDLSAVETDASL